jgi:hypothetical protein
MDDLRAICAKQVVFLRGEALALGYDDRTLQRLRRHRVIHRVRHGAYLFEDTWRGLDERGRHLVTCAAVLRTAQQGAVLSHFSAVAAYDLPLWELPMHEVHLTRTDRHAGRSQAGVRQHRGRLSPAHVTSARDLPVTSAARTGLDLTTLTDVEHALPVLCEMLRRELTTTQELWDQYQAMRHVPGTLASDVAIRLADGRLESVGECRSYYMFFRQALPMPELQFEVFDDHGLLLGRVDFAWPELGVYVEFDGKEKYQKFLREGEDVIDVVRREKKREERICRATGWRCIRLVWADLYYPERTCAAIREMFALSAR